MHLLLDTHTFLWFIAGDARLAHPARQLIEDQANARYLSVASLWEMTIKASLGRLSVPGPPSTLVRDHVRGNAIDLLPVAPNHLDVLQQLPYHHKDPFDRLLIAQAISEDLVLVARDRAFNAYAVRVAWA